MKTQAQTQTALRKGLRVFKALRGHTLNGMSNAEIAQASGCSRSDVTRIMQALIEEGLAEKREDGRFTLGIATLQIATLYQREVATMQEKICEIHRRVN